MSADSPRVTLDLSLWPIVVLTVQSGAKASDYLAVFARYETDVFSRQERYVSVTNLVTRDGVPTPSERKLMTEWMEKNASHISRWSIGNTTVIRSVVVRGAVTALYWVQKPPTPQTVHGALREAIEWSLTALDDAGIARPTGVEGWYVAQTRAGHALT